MEIVSNCDEQEQRFNVTILHGICLDVTNFVSDRIRNTFDANHYSLGSFPWQLVVLGETDNITSYLDFITSEMKWEIVLTSLFDQKTLRIKSSLLNNLLQMLVW